MTSARDAYLRTLVWLSAQTAVLMKRELARRGYNVAPVVPTPPAAPQPPARTTAYVQRNGLVALTEEQARHLYCTLLFASDACSDAEVRS